MGILDNKACGICGAPIGLMGGKKLNDGYCCKTCEAKLSPWFHERKTSTVDELAYQIACREKSLEKFRNFKTTRTFGTDTKVFLDDTASQFVINGSGKKAVSNPDVFSLRSWLLF